jgi:sterol desaturase/sphingolipid hydroxylase (fatty acid hydroxylase superfamily)
MITNAYLPLLVAGLFLLFLVLEKWFPLRQMRMAWTFRLILNLAISGLAFATALLFVRPAAMRTLNWSADTSFGILHVLPLPRPAQAILGFLLLDLSFYYWHLLNHKLPILWRFHNVHHIDPDLDVSTGFRFHFGEVLFSTFFRVIQVSLLGISLETFLAYEFVFQANTLFHHSNVRLPIGLERLLNLMVVTPRMHGIHHSQVKPETNSNYGVVFSVWDKLHRTIGLNIPQRALEIGMAGYSSPEDNRFWRLLALPVGKQRDYWRKPDGTMPSRQLSTATGNRHQLAE